MQDWAPGAGQRQPLCRDRQGAAGKLVTSAPVGYPASDLWVASPAANLHKNAMGLPKAGTGLGFLVATSDIILVVTDLLRWISFPAAP